MPKASDKKKGTKRRHTNTSSAEDVSDIADSKAAKKKKHSYNDGIAMSKQLISKLKEAKHRTRSTRSATIKNNEPRICGNGKLMPSLAELERMFEDSDDDKEPTATSAKVPPRCKTPEPEKNPPAETKDILSPKTLKQIATKVLDLISNLPESIALDDDSPKPPIIPQKKPKKSGIPYIVGCKERKQVPWAPKTSFCKGDENYGIDVNAQSDSEDDENSCPKKRRRMGPKLNLSKSVFNAMSNEIAENLNALESNDSPSRIQNNSPDSNKTIEYEYTPSKNISRSFSPLPSTSHDNKTIKKNDHLFSKSILSDGSPDDDDVELVGTIDKAPCETIVLDETLPFQRTNAIRLNDAEDDSCLIVESNVQTRRDSNSPIVIDDYYSSLDLTANYDDDEVCEVIDVDNILAENNALINKYRTQNELDSVTFVDPNISYKRESNSELPMNTTQNSVVDITPDTNTSENNPITSVNSNSNRIGDIVTNFFRNPFPAPDITDLSSTTSNAVVKKISSWLSSIESYLQNDMNKNRNCAHVINADSDILRNIPGPSSGNATVNREDRSNIGQNRACMRNASTCTTCHIHPKIITPRRRRRISPEMFLPKQQNSPLQMPPSRCCSLFEPQVSAPVRNLGDCPICMDNFSNANVASTICGHIFCMACIKAAIKANGKKCPTCRKPLKGIGYHQLFL